MNWLKTNWRIILIVLNIPILIFVSIWFWYWSKFNLDWDNENAALFNNIVTPFATIISGVLVYLALKASIKQNKISVSQNLKENFDSEFELLKEQLEDQVYAFEHDPFLSFQETGIRQPLVERNSINIFKYFDELGTYLGCIEHYREDLQHFYNGKLFDSDYSYVDYIKFLNPFALHGVHGTKRIKKFVEKIIASELLEQDKIHFKHRVRQELLDRYLKFMWAHRRTEQQFMIPMLYKPRKEDGKVEFKPFAFSKIGEDYEFFNTECEEISNG